MFQIEVDDYFGLNVRLLDQAAECEADDCESAATNDVAVATEDELNDHDFQPGYSLLCNDHTRTLLDNLLHGYVHIRARSL